MNIQQVLSDNRWQNNLRAAVQSYLDKGWEVESRRPLILSRTGTKIKMIVQNGVIKQM